MKKLSFIALLGAMLVVQAYAGAPSANVRLKTNQQMVNITLAANPTTGYQWFVQNYNHDLLSLQNYRYIPNNVNDKTKVGTGGVAVFSFAVDPRFYDAPQTTDVTFVYQQPWSPGRNATVATVTVSATSSSNDLSSWQKYPQLAGPAAEVQASEASIYAQAQGQNQPIAVPTPMVTLPNSANTAANAAIKSNAQPAVSTTSAASTTSAPASSSSVSNSKNQTYNPAALNSDQVMPVGEPTPDTNSQSQWLNVSPNVSTSNNTNANTSSTKIAPASTNAGNNNATVTSSATSTPSPSTTSKSMNTTSSNTTNQ